MGWAAILCAGVTSYKAIKEADVRPGQFVTISGASGGLGHLAIQYAVAMGLRVVALSRGKDKLDYCKRMGAEAAFDVTSPTVEQEVIDYTQGGSHGVICIATNPTAYASAIKMTRRKGTVVGVSLPAGTIECPIFDVVLKRLTIRGSIVGTRSDALVKPFLFIFEHY
jgi:propanol-preferring alcohol dehydrogenase